MVRCLRGYVMALLIAAPAAAMAGPPSARAAGEDEFFRGRELAELGECEQALRLFQTSQQLAPNPVKLLNIATCEEQMGQLASALRDYRAVATEFAAGDKRRQIAEERISAITDKLPSLRITLAPGAPRDTEINLDDLAVDTLTLGAPTPIVPGEHVVTVTASGLSVRRYTIRIDVGKSVEIAVAPGAPMEFPALPPDEPVSTPDRGLRTAGFAVGGIGLLGLGVGAVTGILTLVRHAEWSRDCTPRSCGAAALAEAGQGKALGVTSTAAFSVGLVGLGVGAVVLWQGSQRKPTLMTRVALLPAGTGAALHVQF